MSDAHGNEGGTIFSGFGGEVLGLFGLGGHGHGGGHGHSKFDHYVEELAEWGVSRALLFWVLFIGLMSILAQQIPNFGLFVVEWMAGTAPLWLPVASFWLGWSVWMMYVQSLYLSGRETMVLEIKIPREIMKSPRAMEIVFETIFTSSGEASFIDRAWKGQVRAWFSFEYASFGGEVHFYVWTWKNYQPLVERALYAMYPEIEIHPAEDYASRFNFDPHHYQVFAMDYSLSRPDAYPLKTYIDFELDKDPKEEYKIEPLAELFELLSSLKPNEQMWIQIMIRTIGKTGVLSRTSNDWQKTVEAEVQNIRDIASLDKGETLESMDKTKSRFPRPTWRQTEQMKAIERNLGKTPYDVGMRAIYIADITHGGQFHGPTMGMLRLAFKPLGNAQYMNSLNAGRGHHIFEFPWQDLHNFRHNLVTRRYLDAYRRRSYFYHPWITPSHVMSTEVLATLYHFPSSGVAIPGLQRIPAKKAEPPQNLPK